MKLIVCKIFFLLGFALLSTGATPDPKIRMELLKDYDRMALPNYILNRTLDSPSFVTVTIGSLTNDKNQTFDLRGFLSLSWHDNRLAWNTIETNADADDSSYLHFQPDEIWVPDITLYDGASLLDFGTYGKSQCLVSSSGKVIWVPSARFVAHCDLNLRKWPKDTQQCKVKLGSWTYHREELDMRFANEKSRVLVVGWLNKEDSEWQVIGTRAEANSTKYPSSPESYTSVEYTFILRRRSTLHTYTIIMPLILISTVNIVLFLLSRQNGARVTLAAINFLVGCSYLIFFQIWLPELDHVPYVVILYMCNLVVVSLSICSAATVSCMREMDVWHFTADNRCQGTCDNL